MYDPTIGRWITEDPIGFEAGDPNLYRYCGNDPINNTDPSGLDFGPIGMDYATRYIMANPTPIITILGRPSWGGSGDPPGAATVRSGPWVDGTGRWSTVRVTNIGGGNNYCNTARTPPPHDIVGGKTVDLQGYRAGLYRVSYRWRVEMEKSQNPRASFRYLIKDNRGQLLHEVDTPVDAMTASAGDDRDETLQVRVPDSPRTFNSVRVLLFEPVISFTSQRGDFVEFSGYVRILRVQRIGD